MKNWLIPAVVLIAVGGVGLGVGWSFNEWQGDDEVALVPTATAQAGPSQAELDAQRCAAALEAAGNVQPSGGTLTERRIRIPEPIQEAIDRYCH